MAKDDLLNQAINVYLSGLKGLETFISQPTAKYSLSFEQYLILQTIVDEPGVKMMDIARQRQVTRSAVSRQLRVLIKHRYVEQQPDQADRRRMSLVATADGRQVAMEVKSKITHRFSRWVKIYGEDRGQKLLTLLKEFNQQVIQPENKNNEKGKDTND